MAFHSGVRERTAESRSGQQGAPRRRRAEGHGCRVGTPGGFQSRVAAQPPHRPLVRSQRRPGTRVPTGLQPPARDSAAATTAGSAPARKRGRPGGGAWKRFRGRGARAGAAAGAAGKGLAPAAAAAAEGAPRAGDVSAARGPGEAGGPRAEAAGSGRPVGRLSGSSWVRRGGRDAAWSVRGPAGRGPKARAPAGGQALGPEGRTRAAALQPSSLLSWAPRSPFWTEGSE